jgi:nucleoside-diphosphate-sugar epimerase
VRPLRAPVAVTGATGFIGRHLVRRLLALGLPTRALVLPEETVPPELDGVEIVRGDVAAADSARRLLAGAGTVFHLAAVVEDWGSEALHRRVTVGGTEHVLGAAAREGARAVLASSIVVYGDRLGREICHEDTPHGRPLGPYSRSKQAQERIARRLEAEAELEVALVRPANVFGPGSRPWVEEVLVLLRQRGITLIDGGHLNAGLCHVENLVDLLLAAAATPGAAGRAYNAADGSDITWARYFGDLARLAGTPPPRSAPLYLARPAATVFELLWKLFPFRRRPPITHEALNLVGSHHRLPIERARRELGYSPRVGYEEALAGLGEVLDGG